MADDYVVIGRITSTLTREYTEIETSNTHLENWGKRTDSWLIVSTLTRFYIAWTPEYPPLAIERVTDRYLHK